MENADERLLKMIKALIESCDEAGGVNTALNEEQYMEIDRRREEYLEDPKDTYTWEEVKESIRNASKKMSYELLVTPKAKVRNFKTRIR